MKKIFMLTLSLVIAIAAALPALPSSASAKLINFTDVKETSDYYADVYTLVERGIISGYADQSFKPNADITRGQAAKILVNALELEIEPVTKSRFTDVTVKNQYLPYIEALVREDILNGYNDHSFKPQNTLTRAQMAKILVRGYNLPAITGEIPFTDVTTKSSYYGDIQSLYKAGITKGNTATTYSPNSAVKRGQMASFVMRSERATVSNADEKQLNASIVKIDGEQITLSSGSYKITKNLQALFSEKNNGALKNALITATVKGNELLTVASLTITAQGTSNEPVNLNGTIEQGPTASVTPVGANIVSTFDGKLLIESNYISINNLKVMSELVVSSNVQELTINQYVNLLSILEGGQVTIKGLADVDRVTVASNMPIKLQLSGYINELHVSVLKAAIQLGLTSKVNAIITAAGVKVDSLISNYNLVKSNILKVNGEVSVPGNVVPTPGEGTGGEYIPTQPMPSVPETRTGIIQTTSTPAVLIDGKSYEIADVKIAELLHSRNTALEQGKITFVVQSGKIVEVKSLTINNAGTISGGHTVIKGSVLVNADDVILSNLTIRGDLTLTQAVAGSFTANKLIVNGETIVEEQKTAVRAKGGFATLNPAALFAASSETRVTITFNDSTVATFVIKKNNVKMNADETSTISSISVYSNGVELKAGNVLPQIIISGNSTNIELNATIQNIKIESNESIVITGDAAIKNLEINSTKDVALNVKGVVENINVEKDSKISLGSDTKVAIVKSSTNKPVEDIISNFTDVKENIKPENKVDLDQSNKPFAAGVTRVYERFGYYQINTAFTKGKQVRFLFTKPGEKPTYNLGEKVPLAIIDTGTPFKITIGDLRSVPNIVIFLTETDGTILEYKVIETRNNATLHILPVEASIVGNQAVIKTAFSDSVSPAQAMGYVLLFSENGIIAESMDLKDITWEKIDGMNTIKLPLLNANYTEELSLVINGYSTHNFAVYNDAYLTNFINGLYSKSTEAGVENIHLKSLAYSIILNEVTAESYSDFYGHKIDVLYELWKTKEYTIDDLKALSLSLHNFSLELGEPQLGLIPASSQNITPGDGMFASPDVRDGKLSIPPNQKGTYQYLVYDQERKAKKVSVTFTVDGQNELQATYNVEEFIEQSALPFSVSSLSSGDTVVLTFKTPVTSEDALSISTASSNYTVSPNEENTIFTIMGVKANYKIDEQFIVNFAGRKYSFAMREDFTLTTVSRIE